MCANGQWPIRCLMFAQLMLTSIPDIEANWSTVCVENERMHFDTECGNITLLEFTSHMTFDECRFSCTAITDKDAFECWNFLFCHFCVSLIVRFEKKSLSPTKIGEREREKKKSNRTILIEIRVAQHTQQTYKFGRFDVNVNFVLVLHIHTNTCILYCRLARFCVQTKYVQSQKQPAPFL